MSAGINIYVSNHWGPDPRLDMYFPFRGKVCFEREDIPDLSDRCVEMTESPEAAKDVTARREFRKTRPRPVALSLHASAFF